MTEHEFTDANGLTWYVSEGFKGVDRYLRFDSADVSRRVFTYRRLGRRARVKSWRSSSDCQP